VLAALQDQHPLPAIVMQHRKMKKLLSDFVDTLVDRAIQQQQQQPGRGASTVRASSSRSGGHHRRRGIAAPATAATTTLAAAAADHLGAVEVPGEDLNSGPRLVRLHGQYMQTNSATGRLTMEEPSLQNIPRPVEFELALSPVASQQLAVAMTAAASRHAEEATGDAVEAAGTNDVVMLQQLSNIRAAFVAPPGCVLLSADYCQIELRLMAHFSGDAQLLAALAAGDPFKQLAAQWLKKDQDQVRVWQYICNAALCLLCLECWLWLMWLMWWWWWWWEGATGDHPGDGWLVAADDSPDVSGALFPGNSGGMLSWSVQPTAMVHLC
jgi:hypothetical protein